MKNTKAILIDAYNQEVREVELDHKKGLDKYYELLDCQTFAVPYYLDIKDTEAAYKDAMMVDDEGLYNQSAYFKYKDIIYPVIGNALIVGTDEEGDTIDHRQDIEEVKENVEFWTREQVVEHVTKHRL